MSSLQAIETVYDGHRFRSRLEARWAVFFNSLHIPYEYEKEGYNLDGLFYLPNFWMPDHKYWIEIKAEKPTLLEIKKCYLLAKKSLFPVFVFYGPIPAPCIGKGGCRHINNSAVVFLPNGQTEDNHWWCECSQCGELEIKPRGATETMKCKSKNLKCRGANDRDTYPLFWGYEDARKARFEHGEHP